VTLHGRIHPALAGVRVTRQVYDGRRWRKSGSTTTGANGHYAFTFAPTAKGRRDVRVVVASYDGRAAGFSPTRRLRVL
jgi:hypothetical protein